MKLSTSPVLLLVFIYHLFFSNLATAQNAEPTCPGSIYDTGLYLGWGSALLEYTQIREAPSPFDQVIVEQLQGAYNTVERAALACEPAIPAWPGWKQKQTYLLGQIENLQKTYDHKFKRQNVYNSINGTYYSWGSELSIMVIDGKTVSSTTCATCYFRLGFSTAYATQAFRQGGEALRNNDVKEARRQIKLASNYLMRALKVLDDYEDIQKPRGSIIIQCIDLRGLDLKNRINSLIRNSGDPNNSLIKYTGDPNNIENYILLANSISFDIKNTLDMYSAPVNNNNSYEYCKSKYCPECDDQIVLFETAVNEDCQKCLDKHKDLIAKCMNKEASPKPVPTPVGPEPVVPKPVDPVPDGPVKSDIKCPLKNQNGTYLVLDSNNNPNDNTQVKCSYSSNGLLTSQNPEVNGKRHGEYIEYKFYRNIHYIKVYGHYNNGEKEGSWLSFHYPDKSGKVVLASEIEYRNGVKIVEELYDSRDFLSKRIQYDADGKKSEVTAFYNTGKPSSYSTYNSDGVRLTYKAWHKDGREK
jgi:antitoxin component YwqK of YwqJK toxin-antitoxin module